MMVCLNTQAEEQAGQGSSLFVQITMHTNHCEPVAIHVYGRHPKAPVYIPHYNITKEGFFEGAWGGLESKENFLKASESTPWVNISPLLACMGDNRVRFEAITAFNQPVKEACFFIHFSRTMSKEGLIKTFRRTDSGAGLVLVIDLTKAEDIRSEIEWSREYFQFAGTLPEVQGKRAQRFPIITGCQIDTIHSPMEVITNELSILSNLGFNGLRINSVDQYSLPRHPIYNEFNFRYYSAYASYFHLMENKCLNQPITSEIKKRLEVYINKIKDETIVSTPLFIKLMDEPKSVSLAHMKSCPVCKELFRKYLKSKEISPSDFNQNDWLEVKPTEDRENKPELYYWSVLFRNQILANAFALGTSMIHKMLPSIKTMANYGNDLFGSGTLFELGADWFLLQGSGALTYCGSEDWLNTATSYQQCGYLVAFMRAACKDNNQKMNILNVLWERHPWDIKVKSFAEIGYGVDSLDYFNYGPYYLLANDQQSHRKEIYKSIKEVNYAIGAIEDSIIGAEVPKSKIAFLYSRTSDIWNLPEENGDLSHTLFGGEMRELYLLVRHLGYPIDILTEKDVNEGRLTGYELLFIVASHLDEKVVNPLTDWVASGGRLYMGAGSASYNQYNQPLYLRKKLGVPVGNFEQSESSKLMAGYPQLKVLNSIINGTNSIDVVCGIERIASEKGKIVASFCDGTPALLDLEYGVGKVVLCCFFPGISYARDAVINKNEQRLSHTRLPPEYPLQHRELFTCVFDNIQYKPWAVTDHYLIEANVLKTTKGMLVVLANWTGVRQENVVVTIRSEKELSKLESVINPIKIIKKTQNEVILQINLDEGDFIECLY